MVNVFSHAFRTVMIIILQKALLLNTDSLLSLRRLVFQGLIAA